MVELGPTIRVEFIARLFARKRAPNGWTVPRLAHTEDDDALAADADQMLLL